MIVSWDSFMHELPHCVNNASARSSIHGGHKFCLKAPILKSLVRYLNDRRAHSSLRSLIYYFCGCETGRQNFPIVVYDSPFTTSALCKTPDETSYKTMLARFARQSRCFFLSGGRPVHKEANILGPPPGW